MIILMLHLKTASLLSECSEYRTKCDNLYHLCQMQEKELEHLRALIDAHNIDY
uniref:YdfC protein n=1 Tax=Escherichia coli TaxID=562 RepID=Q9F545_ECOLX|nr:YdfC protein [Escherichia coli]BAB12632.1 ydfC [Escherichia coli]